MVVQWADLIICKTRWLSIQSQGMRNKTMNFGIFFETILTAYLMYSAGLNSGLNTRPLRLTHWFPAMPFTIFIFGYDELRKYIMRCTSPVSIDKSTGRTVREPGWLERKPAPRADTAPPASAALAPGLVTRLFAPVPPASSLILPRAHAHRAPMPTRPAAPVPAVAPSAFTRPCASAHLARGRMLLTATVPSVQECRCDSDWFV